MKQPPIKTNSRIFENIHPIGTAKSVIVHDVTITSWKPGHTARRLEDVLQFTVRYTLYWKSPLTTDGYTKVSETFDTETQRYVQGQLLETNGMTKDDAAYLGGFIGGALLRAAMENGSNQ